MRVFGGLFSTVLFFGCSQGPGASSDSEGSASTSDSGGASVDAQTGIGGNLSGVGGADATAGNDGGTGVGDEGSILPDEVTPELCASQDQPLVGRTLLSRMTRSQYNNTVNDLLSIVGDPAEGLSPDERVGPFVSNSRTPITDLLVQQYQEIAIEIAESLLGRENEIAGCDLAENDCSDSFITNFGRLSYRRPLEDSERTSYASLFALGAEESPQIGFQLVVETMLQSPFFLYHVDVGPYPTVGATASPLTDYELASRLSYFLWDTMPDAELFNLAESGSLNDDAILTSQVARLLESPRAGNTIAAFVRQWLRVGDMSGVEKDAALFPQYGPELRDAMVTELGAFADSIIRQGDGLMSSLFLSTSTPMQSELFSIYGMTAPLGFVDGQIVELPSQERSGVLTRAAFLATQAHRNQTSPVHRGLAIRENLLCQPLEGPPPDVNNVPPSPTEATTTRERFAAHSENITCASCHRLMDPIGLGFESFDPIGAYRSTDGGQDVDATGELVDVNDDILGPFDGAIELSQKLAGSQDVADCMASQWFRFALGRVESNDDGCSLLSIRDRFNASGHNIRSLIQEIVLSDAFRTVRLQSTEEVAP